jgi:hypothetical protein
LSYRVPAWVTFVWPESGANDGVTVRGRGLRAPSGRDELRIDEVTVTMEEQNHNEAFRAIPLWLLRAWLCGKVSDLVFLTYHLLQGRSHPVISNGKWVRCHRVETSARAIAEHFHVKLYQAKYALRKLEKLGLIRREHTQGDTREYLIIIPYLPPAPESLVNVLDASNPIVPEATTRNEEASVPEEGCIVPGSVPPIVPEATTRKGSGSVPPVVPGSVPGMDQTDQIPPKQLIDPDQREKFGEGFRSPDPQQWQAFVRRHWPAIVDLRWRFRKYFPGACYEGKNITNNFLDRHHLELFCKGATQMEIAKALNTHKMATKEKDPTGTADPVKVYKNLQATLNQEKRWLRPWQNFEEPKSQRTSSQKGASR